MIQWGPYWWSSSSLEDKMISQVTNLWGLFDEDYHQNIPKKDTLNLWVNLVSWGTFEDILTSLNSSRVWVWLIYRKMLHGTASTSHIMSGWKWQRHLVHLRRKAMFSCLWCWWETKGSDTISLLTKGKGLFSNKIEQHRNATTFYLILYCTQGTSISGRQTIHFQGHVKRTLTRISSRPQDSFLHQSIFNEREIILLVTLTRKTPIMSVYNVM